MKYTPRGKAAIIISAMAKEPEREFTRAEVAALGGLEDDSVSAYMAAARRNGAVFSRKEGRATYWRITPFGAGEQVEFKVANWSDGDMVIYGAAVCEDGSVLLNANQKAVLRRMLVGEAAA